MHAFKLSVTAGKSNSAYAAGTVTNALCLVDSDEVNVARDRALIELDALGWESCTFLDVARMPASQDVQTLSPAVQEAFADAKTRGAALIVYPPAVAAS